MADTFYGLPYGYVLINLGPPKTGKSTFAGSVCEVVPPERVAVLCTAANEANSFKYREYGLKPEMFIDSEWDPELKLYKATAFMALRQRIKALAAQPADKRPHAYIIDSGTNVVQLKSNAILATMKLPGQSTPPADVGELRNKGSRDASFAYYNKMAKDMQNFMNHLVEVAVSSPAFIILPWHTQPISEEEKGEGVTFEGKVLPMVEGGYRQKLAGDVDIVVYSDVRRTVKDGKAVVEYVVQLQPTVDRHAAVRGMPMPAVKEIPNSFAALHELMLQAPRRAA